MYNTFYKVIVVKIDIFESMIIDERHFDTKMDADGYSDKMKEVGYVTIVATM